jgi:methylmalonyl-CoA/ethylmalonyl-CoA epimerase
MQESTPKSARIAHVGIALEGLSEAMPFYREILGLEEIPIADSDGARIAAFQAGESLVELLETDRPESPIGKFLAKRGPGIHHICFAVPDLDAALQRCRDRGVRLIDDVPRLGAEGKRIAFIHPSATSGILIELSEY